MVTAPVDVDVEAVVLVIVTFPEQVNPVSVPREIMPGCAASMDNVFALIFRPGDVERIG
jgi:hypothetical protein